MNRKRITAGIAAATAALAVAACSGGGGPPAAPATRGASASPSTSQPAAPASPYKVAIVSAGPLTSAEQNQYGMDSPAVVYKVTNVSSSPGRPDVTVQFLNGQDVVSSGYAGELPELLPGQSEVAAEGDSLSDGGTGQPWKSVSIISVYNEAPGNGSTYPVTGVSAAAQPASPVATQEATPAPSASPLPCMDNCGQAEPVILTWQDESSQIRPAMIGIGADNVAYGITWQSWPSCATNCTGLTAVGNGTTNLDTCTPQSACAGNPAPVTVTLSDPIAGSPSIWGALTETIDGQSQTYPVPQSNG